MTGSTDSEGFYRAALRRLYRTAAVLGIAGGAGCGWAYGWAGVAGFGVGAAASVVTLRSLQKMVEALGQPGKKQPRKRIAVLLGLRYVVIGAAGYVIIRAFGANPVALVLGLSLMVASVLGEALYELVYART